VKRFVFFAIVALMILYLLGPTPGTPQYRNEIPVIPETAFLDEYVSQMESLPQIKEGNEARILWADPGNKVKTPVAIVYLHGFTASHREGFPVHQKIARKYGCNLYLARLSDHGIDTTDALYEYTADRVWDSAVKAFAIGKALGDEVILMSTSTGGTLALRLAATYPEIKGIINYSPNIEINDPAAFLLNDPWGLQLARLNFGGDFRELEADSLYQNYWYHRYRLEAIVELQELVESTCTEDLFQRIKCPVFNGCFYRDEANQDPVVRVEAIKRMHNQISTAPEQKLLVTFPNANTHVIACDLYSEELTELSHETDKFCRDILRMRPID
jgi:esterase/lipase